MPGIWRVLCKARPGVSLMRLPKSGSIPQLNALLIAMQLYASLIGPACRPWRPAASVRRPLRQITVASAPREPQEKEETQTADLKKRKAEELASSLKKMVRALPIPQGAACALLIAPSCTCCLCQCTSDSAGVMHMGERYC